MRVDAVEEVIVGCHLAVLDVHPDMQELEMVDRV